MKNLKPSQMLWRAFWAGYVFHATSTLFAQDLIGKEAYLKRIQDHWWDIHWAWWIPLILFCLFYMYRLLNRVNE